MLREMNTQDPNSVGRDQASPGPGLAPDVCGAGGEDAGNLGEAGTVGRGAGWGGGDAQLTPARLLCCWGPWGLTGDCVPGIGLGAKGEIKMWARKRVGEYGP